jgi:hypothetical protein
MSEVVWAYLRKCSTHISEAFGAAEHIMTWIVPPIFAIVTYFGLTKVESIPSWVTWLTTIGALVLCFIFFVQFNVWRKEVRRVEELEARLTPRIQLFIDPTTNGIETAKGQDYSNQYFIQVHARAAGDSIINECVPHITRVLHRVNEGAGFSELISESLQAVWSYQPTHLVKLERGITHRFNIASFADTGGPRDETRVRPKKLEEQYTKIGRQGTYRYRVHVGGRDITPVESFVDVTWREVGGMPLIQLEPI